MIPKHSGQPKASAERVVKDIRRARPSGAHAIDGWLRSIDSTFQITEPSRWMATQAIIFLPTLIGSTRQYMMNGVPSFM